MLPTTLFYALATAFSVYAAEPAPEAHNEGLRDVVLRADFPTGGSQTVVGVIQFYESKGKTKVHVDVTGLPKNSGLFSYHIHEKQVGIDGNCDATGGHFNPLNAPENCDAQPSDAYCEIGDLSGKHGLINTTCFETFYYDPYLSLDPASPYYIGGKSIVIHLVDKNNERLACGNIRPSRDPEDLLLLNPASEAQEVKKYEELAGISLGFDAESTDDGSVDGNDGNGEEYSITAAVEELEDSEDTADALSRREVTASDVSEDDEDNETIVEEIVEVVEEEDDSDEGISESETESTEDTTAEDEEKELDQLIKEDFSNKYSSFNSSNLTVYNTTQSHNVTANITGDDDDLPEENTAPSFGVGVITIGVGIAFVLGLYF